MERDAFAGISINWGDHTEITDVAQFVLDNADDVGMVIECLTNLKEYGVYYSDGAHGRCTITAIGKVQMRYGTSWNAN